MTFAKDQSIGSDDHSKENKNKLTTDAIAGATRANQDQQSDEQAERTIDVQRSDRAATQQLEPLFDGKMDGEFRSRWREIQTGFVDEPRQAVEQADELVAELMQRLAQTFSEQRTNLEHQWDASDKVSTEELRVALTRYRSFFERLLSV